MAFNAPSSAFNTVKKKKQRHSTPLALAPGATVKKGRIEGSKRVALGATILALNTNKKEEEIGKKNHGVRCHKIGRLTPRFATVPGPFLAMAFNAGKWGVRRQVHNFILLQFWASKPSPINHPLFQLFKHLIASDPAEKFLEQIYPGQLFDTSMIFEFLRLLEKYINLQLRKVRSSVSANELIWYYLIRFGALAELWIYLHQKNKDKEPLEFDPEIECTLWRIRKKSREVIQQDLQEEIQESFLDQLEIMAKNQGDNAETRRTLGSYTNLNPGNCGSSIVTPAVNANNFEWKP
ncbi:hypothetical protein PIB30_037699 [Stylosanthes scabra]|uniref:Uncharacterized protein n=1 Tax=Stylosanthes scabra TaxID=79078 RepID=A0ABU6YFR8_9FABA|nr:hypothetical protein [Stylosanthes scabra]